MTSKLLKINNWPHRPYFIECEVIQKLGRRFLVYPSKFRKYLKVKDYKLSDHELSDNILENNNTINMTSEIKRKPFWKKLIWPLIYLIAIIVVLAVIF